MRHQSQLLIFIRVAQPISKRHRPQSFDQSGALGQRYCVFQRFGEPDGVGRGLLQIFGLGPQPRRLKRIKVIAPRQNPVDPLNLLHRV